MKNRKGDVHGSLENENGGFEERLKMNERLPSSHADLIRGHITHATQNYKTAIISRRITKMPLWSSNADPLTLLTWKRHGNDVAMMWKVSSTKY